MVSLNDDLNSKASVINVTSGRFPEASLPPTNESNFRRRRLSHGRLISGSYCGVHPQFALPPGSPPASIPSEEHLCTHVHTTTSLQCKYMTQPPGNTCCHAVVTFSRIKMTDLVPSHFTAPPAPSILQALFSWFLLLIL